MIYLELTCIADFAHERCLLLSIWEVGFTNKTIEFSKSETEDQGVY